MFVGGHWAEAEWTPRGVCLRALGLARGGRGYERLSATFGVVRARPCDRFEGSFRGLEGRDDCPVTCQRAPNNAVP